MAISPLSILYKSNIEHNILDIKLYVYVVLFEPYYQYIRLFTTNSLFIETLDQEIKMQQSQKPKTLNCYICGREFGTTSLSIHLKSCAKKFENEQSKKQTKDRIAMPQAPEQLQQLLAGDIDVNVIEIYNQKAINIHKYQVLPKCRFCDRTFNEDSLKAHQNGCSKKGNQKVQDKSGYQLPDAYKKPRTLTCCVCGRDFGLTSLKIHYPKCLQKFTNDEKKKPKAQRKQAPQFSQQQVQMINTKEQWTLQDIEAFNKGANNNYRDNAMVQCPNCGRKFIQESYQKHKKNCVMINGKKEGSDSQPKSVSASKQLGSQLKKPRTLQCCVCGRQFGLTSLKIHYPQCIQKFNNQQKKKPKAERKQAPQFSQQQLQMINNKQDWTMQDVDAFNNKANNNYRDNAMVQCPNCGRKFIESSYLKHKKNCQLINGTNKNSSKSVAKQKQRSSTSMDGFRPTSPEFKKPRTLTCCVCGRDFGLTSLKIHYPQCLEKFIIDQKKKEKADRKEPPQFTPQQLQMINSKNDWTMQQIQAFNNKANGDYREKAMVQCPNCGRKFIEESYNKHKKNCVMINGKKEVTTSDNSTSKISVQPAQMKKPKVLMCHICGRQFGLSSLAIHQPQCQQKFTNGEKKKPKQERRPLPTFPSDQLQIYDIQTASQWSIEKIQEYNKIANEVYRAQSLCACPICGRKFFQQSLPKHMKFCEKNKEKQASVEKKLQNEGKSSSLGKDVPLTKKSSSNGSKLLQKTPIQKIEEEKQQELSNPSIGPSPTKKGDNESFLKSQLYKKIGSPSNQSKIDEIQEADQSLQQTVRVKALLRSKLQQLNEEEAMSKSVIEEQTETSSKVLDDQKDNKKVQKQQKIQKSQMSQSKMLKKKPSLTEKDNKNTKDIKQKAKQLKIDQSVQSEANKSMLSNVEVKSQIMTPNARGKSSKGFAAPRKKQESLQANMKQCKICTRKFADDKIQKHERLCFENKQRQRKSQKNIDSQSKIQQNMDQDAKKQASVQKNKDQVNERDILTPEQKIRQKKGFAAPREKESEHESKMVECRGCKRKFAQDRIQKHEGICKQAQEQIKQPFVAGSYKKIEQNIEGERVSIKRAPCPKCNRKFAEDRLQKHLQICKASGPEPATASGAKLPQKQPQNKVDKIETEKQFEKQAFQNVNLECCQKCGRKFNSQRIAKHQEVCKGTLNQNQTSISSNAFKKAKETKEIKQVGKTYDLQKIQVKNPLEADDRAQCPKCLRKFASDRLQKHMGACKLVPPLSTVQSKHKVAPKIQLNTAKQKPILKPIVQTPKNQQKLVKTIGDDQYVENELQQCLKCSRKFIPERLQKHMQICKGTSKQKEQRSSKNGTQLKKKLNEEQIRKTKNQFFTMVKDLKHKKIKDEEIEQQLDSQLQEIQVTSKMSRKENINRENSQRKKKEVPNINKSINLPKI